MYNIQVHLFPFPYINKQQIHHIPLTHGQPPLLLPSWGFPLWQWWWWVRVQLPPLCWASPLSSSPPPQPPSRQSMCLPSHPCCRLVPAGEGIITSVPRLS